MSPTGSPSTRATKPGSVSGSRRTPRETTTGAPQASVSIASAQSTSAGPNGVTCGASSTRTRPLSRSAAGGAGRGGLARLDDLAHGGDRGAGHRGQLGDARLVLARGPAVERGPQPARRGQGHQGGVARI